MSENGALRYPIGRFKAGESVSAAQRAEAVEVIAQMPERLKTALQGLDESQVDTPYREGGWTVRQLVHHIADSHMTAFHRVRRTLTEEVPTLPGYDEKGFAELADKTAPVAWSVGILEAVHARWVMMLKGMNEAEWEREFNHTERGRSTIEAVTQLYSWHARHHVAHIVRLRERMGW